MTTRKYQIEVQTGGDTLTVTIDSDTRLRTSARWTMRGSNVNLRVPRGMTREEIDRILNNILPRISRQRKRATRQSDASLMQRAQALNERYFNGELSWHSIRWVSNMKHRLGSFTTGGATDGDIRVSDAIRDWPDYVIDYILAHEICHRKFPNHSAEFWQYLARYPFTDKAVGFIDGVAYASGADAASLLD
jgi:predicted metal-dependent hydrolase